MYIAEVAALITPSTCRRHQKAISVGDTGQGGSMRKDFSIWERRKEQSSLKMLHDVLVLGRTWAEEVVGSPQRREGLWILVRACGGGEGDVRQERAPRRVQ